jgi:hypothetical protein
MTLILFNDSTFHFREVFHVLPSLSLDGARGQDGASGSFLATQPRTSHLSGALIVLLAATAPLTAIGKAISLAPAAALVRDGKTQIQELRAALQITDGRHRRYESRLGFQFSG